ncbi:MAG TPA: hypothetical protein PKA19_07280 [Bacillota bacterium]|nr:hypothetical protein [Bacillota bacterium]
MKKLFMNKKAISFILALTMVLAMSSVAWAVEPGDYLYGDAIPPSPSNLNCSSYLATPPAMSTSAVVTLVIETGDLFSWDEWGTIPDTAFREEITTTLSSITPKNFTVEDVLDEIDGSNGLDFDIRPTSRGDYLQSVSHDGDTWESGQLGFDGWTYRVNDKFPVELIPGNPTPAGYWGTYISNTYVQDGDVVHLFYDFPSDLDRESGSLAAQYVRGVYECADDTTLIVQLQGHQTYIDPLPDYFMSVYNYTDLGAGIVAKLYPLTGGTAIGTAVSNAQGEVTFTGSFDSNQKYILKTQSVLNSLEDNDNWGDMLADAYFTYTGAYSLITLP